MKVYNADVQTLMRYCNLIEQVRYPVLLTPAEKQMAREVCIAFRQAVCWNSSYLAVIVSSLPHYSLS